MILQRSLRRSAADLDLTSPTKTSARARGSLLHLIVSPAKLSRYSTPYLHRNLTSQGYRALIYRYLTLQTYNILLSPCNIKSTLRRSWYYNYIFNSICFSGDHDMCVPYTGTEAWTASLGYGVIDSWRPWITDEEVSGYLNNQWFSNFCPRMFALVYPRD